MGRGRVGVGLGLGLGLQLVSKVVFLCIFRNILSQNTSTALEPHVDHIKFPEFYTFILDDNPYVR